MQPRPFTFDCALTTGLGPIQLYALSRRDYIIQPGVATPGKPVPIHLPRRGCVIDSMFGGCRYDKARL